MPSQSEAGLLQEGGVVETAHVFGEGLVGILARPREVGDARPAVILLNAGLVHRAGPFRVYAQLARALASCGFAVLRFDQSGLGDSANGVGVVTGPERKHAEADAAMRLVAEQTGIGRFVLAGICSGADDAFRLADGDPRVAGIVLMDGVAYRTTGYKLQHYAPRLLDPGKVLRGVGRMLRRDDGARALDEGDFRDFPPQDEAIARLRRLVERDARVLLLYTGGASRYFNHAGQARECFGPVMDAPQVGLEYWPDCDHTFYLRKDRLRLNTRFSSWLRAQFPAVR
ncbi:serine aminopeptidase domain-containing protein [Pseudoxanthomonas putridarboris]